MMTPSKKSGDKIINGDKVFSVWTKCEDIRCTCTDVQRHTLTYSAVPMVCNLLLAELPKDSQFRWLVLRKDKQEAHKPVYMCPTHGEDGWGEWVRKMVYPFFSMPSEFLYGTWYWYLWLLVRIYDYT